MLGDYMSGKALLTELNIEDSCFYKSRIEAIQLYSDPTEAGHFILGKCPYLERLNIKNVTWRFLSVQHDDDGMPLSQEMLIKMVLRHPTLRWIRSDLTAANIAMLMQTTATGSHLCE